MVSLRPAAERGDGRALRAGAAAEPEGGWTLRFDAPQDVEVLFFDLT
jgi:hypothetical protein